MREHITLALIKKNFEYLLKDKQTIGFYPNEHLSHLKKRIHDYTQEHLPKDQITRGQVTQLLTKVKNAKDVATLEDAFSKIDAIFNTVFDHIIRAKIKNLLSRYKPKRKNGIVLGKLMPEEQASLKEISDIINSDRDEMLSEIETERNEILSQMKSDRTDLSDEEMQDVIDLTDIKDKLRKVDLYSDLKNKTGAELKEIYDEIKSIIEEGKTRRTIIQELWNEKIKGVFNRLKIIDQKKVREMNRLKLKENIEYEYFDISRNIRQCDNIRFVQFSVFLILMILLIGTMFGKLSDLSIFLIRVSGIVLVFLFWVIDEQILRHWINFRNLAISIEKELGFQQYSNINYRRIINTNNAKRLFYLLLLTFWCLTLILNLQFDEKIKIGEPIQSVYEQQLR